MKLREVILKNFRGYYDETRISINDLTALIGKNDVGQVPSRFMRKIVCRLRLSEVNRP